MSDIVKVERNKNFTVMSNVHLRDKKISLKAKGLLSLVLSLPDDWNYTIKGLIHFAKDGIDSFSATMTELEKNGYLLRERERNDKGQVKGTVYTFYESPIKVAENCAECNKLYDISKENYANATKEEPKLDNPVQATRTKSNVKNCAKATNPEPKRAFPVQAFPRQEKPVLLNTNILNKENTKYLSSSKIIDDDVTEKIKEQINYNWLVSQTSLDQDIDEYDKALIDNIVFILSDVLLTRKKKFKIGNKQVDTFIVKDKLNKLGSEHIQYVIECVAHSDTDIRNFNSYLLTCLYNSLENFSKYSKFQTTRKQKSTKNTSYNIDEFEQYALSFNPNSLY